VEEATTTTRRLMLTTATQIQTGGRGGEHMRRTERKLEGKPIDSRNIQMRLVIGSVRLKHANAHSIEVASLTICKHVFFFRTTIIKNFYPRKSLHPECIDIDDVAEGRLRKCTVIANSDFWNELQPYLRDSACDR
jgi:hypothetical protein